MDGAKMIGVIFGALLQIQRTRLKLTASALVGQHHNCLPSQTLENCYYDWFSFSRGAALRHSERSYI